jgi:hypothetical protein
VETVHRSKEFEGRKGQLGNGGFREGPCKLAKSGGQIGFFALQIVLLGLQVAAFRRGVEAIFPVVRRTN